MIDNEFETWLVKNKKLKESSIVKYIGAVRTISKDLAKELGIDLKIYDITDINEFNKIYKLYYDNSELMNKNKKGNNMYSNGLNCYKEFLEDKQNINNIDVKPVDKIAKEENPLKKSTKETNNQIQKYINSKGFIYKNKDLNNFYISLKTKPFVILAGISGTGKSKLVKLFASAIGATSENGQYNIISVKPDWNDSTELFGYKNINDEFVPGKLTEIISRASSSENVNKPYFICLDEMNLARVEYYLSEYLSIIESREFKEGEIVTDLLFSKDYLPKESKYYDLRIPENIYIIGTVNMDDTTFAFSRKVLDRANTIEFSDVDLDSLDFEEEECEPIAVDNSFLKTSFLNIKEALVADDNFLRETNKKVKEINAILKTGNKNFGYRVRDEIVFYMLENKICELLNEDIAFDYQIMQKILPTISGSESIIKGILIDLFNYCIEGEKISGNGDYIKDCETKLKAENIKYKKSAKKILMMLRGYQDGFTSFWA
ncbi:McrB family protein [Clostridium gasigenes]|uniref:McrB family protein n=1 Tax=Clostridium gasigenes TaxID=94869 RepID=UPI001C0DAC50|nr:AAA family ATPase [Clostridium gasigenes]MBU3109484.1 AAA family ATPase [Clostridium gasigenes]